MTGDSFPLFARRPSSRTRGLKITPINNTRNSPLNSRYDLRQSLLHECALYAPNYPCPPSLLACCFKKTCSGLPGVAPPVVHRVCHAIREKGTFWLVHPRTVLCLLFFVIFRDWSIVYLIAWLFHIRPLARHTKLDSVYFLYVTRYALDSFS